MKETLQQIADREGVTRQAVWARTEKGKAYKKTEKYKTYRKAYYLRKKAEKASLNQSL